MILISKLVALQAGFIVCPAFAFARLIWDWSDACHPRFFPVAFRTKRTLFSDKNVYWYNQVPLDECRLPEGMFSTEAAFSVSSVRTVTIAALQLAVHLGFNPIYLIGCDTSYTILSSVDHEKGAPDRLIPTQDGEPNHFDLRHMEAFDRVMGNLMNDFGYSYH